MPKKSTAASKGRPDPFDMRVKNRVTPARVAAFLRALCETCNFEVACRDAGLTPTQMVRQMSDDSELKAMVDDIRTGRAVKLEDTAFERALNGVNEPVYYQGEVVGSARKFNEGLTQFLLRGAFPDKYKSGTTLEGGDKPVEFTLNFKDGNDN